MLLKDLFNNCALDLQRAAQWYYLNPKGKTHLIFIEHARGILAKCKSPRAIKTIEKIREIEEEISKSSARNIYLADKILTIGCLLKQ